MSGQSITDFLDKLDRTPDLSDEVVEACQRLARTIPANSLIFGTPQEVYRYVQSLPVP